MKKLATVVPALAAVAVAAFLVPHVAQASTDPRHPGGSASASPSWSAAPHPTRTGGGHASSTPSPSTSPSGGAPGGTHGNPNPGGPRNSGGPGFPGGPNGNSSGFGGTQPGSWHNTGNQHLPRCGTTQLVVNGGFEQPRLPSGTDHKLYNQSAVPGWRTDDPNGVIELWNGSRMGVPAVDGKQLAEINATGGSDSLLQDLKTVPGSVLNWSVTIRARNTTAGAPDVDTTQVHFGPSPRQGQGGALNASAVFNYRNTADDSHWKTLYGYYEVPDNQTWTRLSLTSVAHSGPAGYGNLIDKVSVTGMKC